jgi:hypothetical protein
MSARRLLNVHHIDGHPVNSFPSTTSSLPLQHTMMFKSLILAASMLAAAHAQGIVIAAPAPGTVLTPGSTITVSVQQHVRHRPAVHLHTH